MTWGSYLIIAVLFVAIIWAILQSKKTVKEI
jgi:hypothetical protein